MKHHYKNPQKRTYVMKMRKISLNPMALAIAIAFTTTAHAAGTGTIVSGNGSISQNQNHTVVKQNTNKMVINWDNMDVGQKEILQFVQPDKRSAVLNRINSLDPTQIDGALTANGQVYIVNPNGVLINKGSTVNVGSLIASSLDIKDSDFIKGNLTFSGGGEGTVSNQGVILSQSEVALIGAGEVNNHGEITTNLGGAVLVAGDDITLSFMGFGLINVKINKGSLRALVNNGGIIRTPGGQIALTAWATDTLTRSVINNTGTLEADQVVMRTDGVYLENNDKDITIAGTVTGTRIFASGGNVNIKDNALIKGRLNTNIAANNQDGYVEFGKSTVETASLSINADNVLAKAEGQKPDFTRTKRVDITTNSNDLVIGDGIAKTSGDLIAGKSIINESLVNSISKSDAVLTVRNNAKNVELGNTNVNYGKLAVHNWSQDNNINIKDSVKGHSLELRGLNLIQSKGADVNMDDVFSASIINNINLNGNINANNEVKITGSQGNIIQSAGSKVNSSSVDYSAKNIRLDGDTSSYHLDINADKFTQGEKSSLSASNANFHGGDYDLSSGETDLAKIKMWNAKSLNLKTNSYTNLSDSTLSSDLKVVSTADVGLLNVNAGGSAHIEADNIIAFAPSYGKTSALTSDKDIALKAKNNIEIQDVKASKDVSVKAGGDITLDMLSGSNIDVASIGTTSLKSVYSDNALNVVAKKDINMSGYIYSGSDMNMSANNIYNKLVPNLIESHGNITLNAENSISVNNLIANSDYSWMGKHSNISMTAKNISTNDIMTEGDIKLNAEQNINAQALRFASNIDLHAGKKVKTGVIQSWGNISISEGKK
ncbi:filamentous hemagglutinin N-terminal domain-containing protein [Erwinia sp. J316]|uniref:Filamentous hemagglutinin N-terminal domain-containing protein n=2 Tax=Erwinia sorbitola TaxID=2681984 RepID=A0ABW9RBR5_9GAMM|nr:filamentous hemagglutinin N-terminal domain-containing protein [Erwinia sorbitola]